jgi:hypothetical protein
LETEAGAAGVDSSHRYQRIYLDRRSTWIGPRSCHRVRARRHPLCQ